MTQQFDCNRTCPVFELVDHCRFNPLFEALGVVASINSKSVELDVEISDANLLMEVILEMGGEVIGESYLTQQKVIRSFIFKLKDMSATIHDGKIYYNPIREAETMKKRLAELTSRYALAKAEQTAKGLNWKSEKIANGLRTYHPNGGYLDIEVLPASKSSSQVSAQRTDTGETELALPQVKIETFKFHGNRCHGPVTQVAKELGTIVNTVETAQATHAQLRSAHG